MLIFPFFYLLWPPFCSLVQHSTDMGPPLSPSDEAHRYHKTPNSDRTMFSSGNGWPAMLSALVLLLCVTPATATTISRVNFGVIFEQAATVDTIYDFWTHTYQVVLPTVPAMQQHQVDCNSQESDLDQCKIMQQVVLPEEPAIQKNQVKCSDQDLYFQQCKVMQHGFETVGEVRRNYRKHILDSLTLAKSLMKVNTPVPHSRSRSKRSLLPFIGDFSHSLFGTATEKEMNQVREHVELLEKRSDRMNEAFSKFSDHLSSFIQVSNSRYENLEVGIMDNHQALGILANRQAALSASLRDDMKLSSLLTQEVYLAMSLKQGLQNFIEGIYSLLNHKLSPHFISFNDVQRTIKSINSKLASKHARLTARSLSARDFYDFDNFVWTFRNNSVFISVKFPLVTAFSVVDIFKTYSFPVPINSTASHCTQIVNLPTYIAFSRDHFYYAFPEAGMWKNNLLNAQERSLPLHPVSKANCITALFFKNKKQIKEMCDFRIRLDAVSPNIIHLNHGQYLVSNISQWFLTCPNGHSRVSGCTFCVFSVPCLCDVSADGMYFPPRLNHCKDDITTATMSHTVNLALFMHLYKEERIAHIDADTTFWDTPRTTDLPDIHIFSHNFSNLIADDKASNLSLKRVADAVKNDKHVFQTLSDPILDSLNLYGYDEPLSLTWILSVTDTAVLGVVVLVIIFIISKISAISRTLAAIQLAQAVQSYINVIPTEKSLSTENPFMCPPQPQYDYHLFGIIVIGLITMLFIAYKYMKRRIRHAFISLEITSGKDCVFIPLATVPYCPKFYHCQAGDNFSNFKVVGWLRPILVWCKGSFRATHLLDNSQLGIPQNVSVSVIQGLKLRKIFRGQFFAYIVAQHANHAFHMNICPLSCISCKASINVVENQATSDVENGANPQASAPRQLFIDWYTILSSIICADMSICCGHSTEFLVIICVWHKFRAVTTTWRVL